MCCHSHRGSRGRVPYYPSHADATATTATATAAAIVATAVATGVATVAMFPSATTVPSDKDNVRSDGFVVSVSALGLVGVHAMHVYSVPRWPPKPGHQQYLRRPGAC
jgi:hypothetical protein